MSGIPDAAGTSDGHWLTAQRLKIYPRIFVAAFFLVAVGWLFGATDLTDPQGKPIGYDFISFWSAARLALAGQPEAAYDLASLLAMAQTAVPGMESPYLWNYPPTFMVAVLPFGLPSYLPAYALWTALTVGLFVWAAWRIVPAQQTVWLALAFPATYLNMLQGQNGLLVAAIFAAAVYYLDRRPILAGVLFGLLSFKPHFGLLVPLALLVGRYWKSFLAATGVTVALAAASLLLFGAETWARFIANIPAAAVALETGLFPWVKMPSAYATLRLLGAGSTIAYAVQLGGAAVVAVAVFLVWKRDVPAVLRGAVLISGSLLVSPYLYDYDLALLGVPILLLAIDGSRRGWQTGEREILAISFLMPLFASSLALHSNIQIGAICLYIVFGLAVRRAFAAAASDRTTVGDANAAGPEFR